MAASEHSVAKVHESAQALDPAPHAGLSIQQLVSTEEHVLRLSGDLDLAGSPALESVLIHVCTHTANRVVLDLSELRFMDSTGIQAVLIAQELCRACGCGFLVVPGPTQVQRLFDITGLSRRLPFWAEGRRSASETAGPAPDSNQHP
jgi:anti-sigma B factor antagonist